MYIPLNNKTSYSLLSSLISIDDLINYAKKNNLLSQMKICMVWQSLLLNVEIMVLTQ